MKLATGVAIASMFMAGTAFALPTFGNETYKFKFTNYESFVDSTGAIVTGPTVGGHAVGILDITQIVRNDNNDVVWNKGDGGQYMSAVFATPTILSIGGAAPNLNVDAGTGGFLNIWLNNSAINVNLGTGGYASGGCGIGGTCYDSITNVGGALYLGMAWGNGIAANPLIGLAATFTSLTSPITGQASGYLDALSGSGLATWDTNGFVNGRDFFAQNDFCTLGSSPACSGATGSDWELKSEDPTIGRAVPEPGSLALVGLSLFGLTAFSRRKRA